MIAFTTRPITPQEQQQAMWKSGSLFKQIERFILILGGIVLMLDIPLLVYDHFKPVVSNAQALYTIIIVIFGLLLTIWITKRRLRKLRRQNEAIPKYIEVIQVRTTRAVKRKDFEDFGIAFYIDVIHEGKRKVLYLWGQYLDVLESENTFPNTEFEIVRLPNKDEFIEFNIIGNYFQEERILPAFDKKTWESGTYPVNGQLVDVNIDSLIESFDHSGIEPIRP